MPDESKLRFEYRKSFIFAIVIPIIALGLIIGGIAYTVVMNNKTKGYIETKSKVIDIVEVKTQDNELLYAEIVEYVVDEQTYTAQNTTSSLKPKSNGSEIALLYNPSNPNEYVFPQNTVGVKVVFFVLGAIFVIVDIAVWRYYFRLKKILQIG